MARLKPLVLGCMALPLASHQLPGQRPADLTLGARVRITADTEVGKPLVGTYAGMDSGWIRVRVPDPLRVDPSGAPTSKTVSVPLGPRSRLEVSRGQRSRAGKGALIGGLVGGGAGLLLGVAAASENSGSSFFEVGPGEVAAVTGMLGALGAGVGALIGAGSRMDRWEPIELPRVTARLRVERDRFGVGFSLRL